MNEIGIKNKRKMLRTLFVVFVILLLLSIRICYIQFINGSELQKLAYEQL